MTHVLGVAALRGGGIAAGYLLAMMAARVLLVGQAERAECRGAVRGLRMRVNGLGTH